MSSPTPVSPPTSEGRRKRKRERVAEKLGWNYITAVGRENAKTYKYSGDDLSLIYKYISSPLAQYLVNNWTPSWMAPNLITFIGLSLVMLSYSCLLFYCPRLQCEEDMPSWPWFLAAFCLFAYGTLDNMDGKQARRTGSSSSLGLLFDHGCDALNTCVFTTQNALFVSQIGTNGYFAYMMFCALVSGFYMATWEEFHLDILILPIINGPNEGLLVMCAAFIVTGALGASVVVTPVYNEYRVNDVLSVATAFCAALTVAYQVYNVSAKLRGRSESLWRPLGRLSPLFVILGSGWLWALHSHDVYAAHPILFMGIQGCLITDSVSKLMVSHVCGQRYRPNWTVISLWALTSACVTYAIRTGQGPALATQGNILWAVFAVTVFALGFFIVYAVNELADALGVKVFRITQKKE